MDTLLPSTHTTQATLRDRLDQAASARADRDPHHARDGYKAVDTFLATVSRHTAAVTAVVVPAARSRVDDGPARAREYVEQSRRLEQALNQVKAKLYGSTYAIRRPWRSIWSDVRREFEAACDLESRLVADLVASRREGDPDWAERLYRTELHAPTRPHPYLPHQGVAGKVARALALRVDRFWDVAEGRMVPEPVRHHDRDHDGRLTQYLLADPHLRED